jgi:DNA primase
VAVVPEGKDPCDLLVLRGPGPLRAALEGARDLFEHVVERALAAHDRSTIGGRAAAADEILAFATRVHDDVRSSLMMEVASARLGIPEAQVKARAKSLVAASAPSPPGARAAAPARPRAAEAGGGSRRERLLLEASLAGEGLAARLGVEAPPETFSSASLARIARAVVETASGGTADPAACAASLGDDVLADEVAVLAAAGAAKPAPALLRQFEDCLRSHDFDRRIGEARRRFGEARSRADRSEEDRWLAELNRLQSERKRPGRAAKR